MADAKPATPQPKVSSAAPGTLYGLALDECLQQAYVGGSDGTVYRVDLTAEKPEPKALWHEDSYISALAMLTVDGAADTLVTTRYDGSVSWHELASGKLVRRVERAHDGWIRDAALDPRGRWLATAGHDMLVKVWNTQTGEPLHTLTGHALETPQGYTSAIYTLAWSPDGRFVASADRVGEIRIWDLERPTESRRLTVGDFYTFDPEKRDRSIGGVRRLRFSPDGQWLAVAGIGAVTNVDGFVGPNRTEVWNWQAGTRHVVLQDSHQAVLNDVIWFPDSRRFLGAGGGDGGGLWIVWSLDQEKPLTKVKFGGHSQRLAWLGPDRIVTAGFESVQVWDVATA